MDFLEKLGELAKTVGDKTVELAKNVGDKTSDILEIGKISAQISTSNSAIEELKTRLGDHYWNLFTQGETLDEDAVVLCNTIKDYSEEIAALKVQLEELKKGSSAQAVQVCPTCGVENTEDAVFCKNCGKKLEEEVCKEDEGCTCETECEIICGEECHCEEAAPAAQEAPKTKACGNCGAENEIENNFCDKCGSKL